MRLAQSNSEATIYQTTARPEQFRQKLSLYNTWLEACTFNGVQVEGVKLVAYLPEKHLSLSLLNLRWHTPLYFQGQQTWNPS